MRRRTALLLCLGSLPGVAVCAAPWPAETLQMAQTIREQALQGDDAYALVDSLTHEVGPRLAGSPGDPKAVAWAVRTLKKLGFSNVHTEPVEVRRWVRGTLHVRVVGDSADLVAASIGESVGTPPHGIEAPLVRTMNIETLNSLPLEAVRGHIVFFDQRTERARDGTGYVHGYLVRKRAAVEAARRGAVAAVVRSVATSTDRIAHTGSMRTDELVRRIPAVTISNADADALSARLDSGHEVRLHIVSTARNAGTARSANVIGEIPGRTDGIVLLGAHLDSWDLAQGANDDGAGVAIVTTAARAVGRAGVKPRCTLRVVLFASEEIDELGARRYVADHASELPRHVIAMEADFGSAPVWVLAGDVPADRWPVVEAIAAELGPLGVTIGPNGVGAGSDVGYQGARGVPLLSPIQDGTHYFDTHHSSADVLANVDRAGLKQAVAVYATLAWLASEYEPGFGRLPVLPAE